MKIRLPFQSRVLIEIDRCVDGSWSLPEACGSIFDALPTCLHERHLEIRNRLIQTWNKPLCQHLHSQLAHRLSSAAQALQERLSTWYLVIKRSIVRIQIENVLACLADLAEVFFRSDRITNLLERTLAHFFKETRNYSTVHWADQAYQKIIARLQEEPTRIERYVIHQSLMQDRIRTAIINDSQAFGFEMLLPNQIQRIDSKHLSHVRQDRVLLTSANQ